jgi:capsular exopolysaccharide synthesis family protein
LRRFAQTIRERLKVVFIVLIATLAIAALYLVTAEKVYEARADVLVTPVPTQDAVLSTIGVITQSPDPTLDVETAAQLIDSPAVAERAAGELGGSETESTMLDAVSVEPIPDSNVVAIVAQDSTPESASDRANAFAEAAVAERQQEIQENIDEVLPQLQQDLANSAGGASADSLAALIAQLSAFRAGRNPAIQVEATATPPSEPSSPRTGLVIVFALVVGLGLGIGGAFAAQVLDPRLRREEQLRSLFRLPILARITRERDGSGPLPPERLSPIAREGYRTLRATIAAAGQSETGPRSIVVGGSGPSEGKSTTAINLAASLTLGGSRVILIEADVRRPVIGKALGITPPSGVISVLLGRTSLNESLTKVPAYGPNLNVLVAEESGADFAELFSLPAAERLLREATRAADYVIIDSPPLGDVVDALQLSRHADAVLIAAKLGQTRLNRVRELAELLAANSIRPIGFVLVGVPRGGRDSYTYHSVDLEDQGRRRASSLTTT